MSTTPTISKGMRNAAAAIYPTDIPKGYLEKVLQEHQLETLEDLQKTLLAKSTEFRNAGGRGIELADEIDALEVAVAMRRVQAIENMKRPSATLRTISLKEILEKATPGNWTIDTNEDLPIGVIQANEDGTGICEVETKNFYDALFIAHARNILGPLVDILEDAHSQFEHNGDESDSDKIVLDKMEAILAQAKTVILR
jgi:hypothetical protein